MLTVDLVRARPHQGELKLTELQGRARSRARQLAEAYLSLAEGQVGETRGTFDEACQAVLVNPRERKLALGLKKMVEDLCGFEADESLDTRELRRQVFQLAARRRQELADGEVFDREALLAEVAHERGQGESPMALLEALYSDLREAHVLHQAPQITAEALVDHYDLAQAQAVLLRATRVVAEVSCRSPATYRHLFGKLKFRRLLYSIQRRGKGYRLEITGPFSIFSSVTRYGLQLALLLPALQLCDAWSLDADLIWGKDRRPLRFSLSGKRPRRAGESAEERSPEEDLPEEVAQLLTQIRKPGTGWTGEPATELLDLPGLGLCVPDLRFEHSASKTVVFLEVMGFWSREAVWQRVELVRAGLPHKIIFAVPKRLRVSEEVLDDELPGELYVYKGKMSGKAILDRLDATIAEQDEAQEQPPLFEG